jgi:phospholipid-binding lipoprotein MlaA
VSVSFAPIALLLAGAPMAAETAPPATTVPVSAPALPTEPPLPAAAVKPPPVSAPSAAPPAEPDQSQSDPNQIIVTARPPSTPGDPLLGANALSFSTVQSVDKAFVGPVSMAYKDVLPSPVRSGLRNFLGNLQEPVVALNFLLQIKPRKALETIGRFTVNSTIGIGGLIDVAKKRPFNGPRRTNGFAYTLGYYGVKPGPYLFLPLIGPTTVRDVVGRMIDVLILPSAFGKPFNRPVYSISTTVVRSLDERAEADVELNRLRDKTSDPYTALRDAYLTKRQAQIDELRGKVGPNSPR